jgi:hypothetical protein
MITTATCTSLRRFAQIFEGGLRPCTRWAIAPIAVLALWSVFSAPAHAACKPAVRSGLANQIAVSQPALSLNQVQKTVPASQAQKTIVGLWHLLMFNPDGSVFDEGYDIWHSDGTEILNDTAPPQPANGSGTVCLGVFEKTGPHSYKLRHVFWSFDATGTLVGNGDFLEEVTVDESGSSFSGTCDFKTFDLKGNLTFEQSGDLKAERITPD